MARVEREHTRLERLFEVSTHAVMIFHHRFAPRDALLGVFTEMNKHLMKFFLALSSEEAYVEREDCSFLFNLVDVERLGYDLRRFHRPLERRGYDLLDGELFQLLRGDVRFRHAVTIQLFVETTTKDGVGRIVSGSFTMSE
jgi:cell wall-associated NlpC family hydrolase